jgi:transcriptional regulator with XRE-family HTH domain
MVLLRKVIGDALRARRLAQHRTLREVSTAANVSLGYLSEIERGHKEASSELLAAICDALGARLSEMLTDVSTTFALEEQMNEAFAEAASGEFANNATRGVEDGGDRAARAGGDRYAKAGAAAGQRGAGTATERMRPDEANVADTAVTDGGVTVQVHSESPLRTTLTAKRITPGQPRHEGPVLV